MDQIIRQFAKKTPVHLLNQYKRDMHEATHLLFNLISNMFSQSNQPENRSSKDCIVTGSMAEGASLARLFSPDDKTSREVEVDFMYAMTEWPD